MTEAHIYAGDRAKEVLENEAFIAAFDEIEQELVNAWKTSPQRDSTGREHIHLALSMLHRVKACIVTTLETGKLAKLELRHQKSLAQRAKAWISPD